GNVRMREPGLLVVGEAGLLNQGNGTLRLENASYVLHEMNFRGTADNIIYSDNEGSITIDNGRFSRCEPGNDSWMFQASEIVLDQVSGVGRARHATLRIRDIPVFYTPYISFPLRDERKSGFLPAGIGSTNNG